MPVLKFVPLTSDNVNKCKCPDCPVQAGSSCVAGLLAIVSESVKRKPLRSNEIPAVYCATGQANCKDIETGRGCLCGTCPVYFEYELSKGRLLGHYCRDGEFKSTR